MEMNSKLKDKDKIETSISQKLNTIHSIKEDVLKIQDERNILIKEIEDKENREINISKELEELVIKKENLMKYFL